MDVNEAYIDRVRPGQRVTAQLDAYADWKIPAKVIAIIPTADRQKATVRVRVGFDAIDPRILPDMGIKVAFMDRASSAVETATMQGLALPASAVVRRDGREVLFLYDEGKARRQAVSALALADGKVLVRSGLAPNARVIDAPPDTLSDGSTVKIEEGP